MQAGGLAPGTLRSAFAALVRDGGWVYAIVDAGATSDPVALLDAALRAGIRVAQYRAKAGVARDLVRRLHRMAGAAGALLVVNDDLEAALEADGLHVGPEDIALLGTDLRARLGQRLLGVSCGSAAEVAGFRVLDADYFGVGPYAATTTKTDAGLPIGAAGVADVVALAAGVPVVAIGGIGLPDLAALAASGAAMVAVSSAFSAQPNPEAALRALAAGWAEARRG